MSPGERRTHADNLASAKHWERTLLSTSPLALVSYAPIALVPTETLTIYIEGDGLAWLTRSIASDNPTPRRPLGLELALAQTPKGAAYLGRPCQYLINTTPTECNEAWWTNRRFSQEVIESSNQAISQLKNRFSAHKLVLVGYSGGGAIAALVAARRHDVVQLITVAGNLDHTAWTRLHGVLPLDGSLNPAQEFKALQSIPQLHLVGSKDLNIPVEIAESYATNFPSAMKPRFRVISGFDHVCCWSEKWPELSRELMQ